MASDVLPETQSSQASRNHHDSPGARWWKRGLLACTVVAVVALAAGIAGFVGRALAMPVRLVLIAFAFIIFLMRFEDTGLYLQLGALVVIIALVFLHRAPAAAKTAAA